MDTKAERFSVGEGSMDHPGSRLTDTPLAPLSEVGMLDDRSTPLLKISDTSELALQDNNTHIEQIPVYDNFGVNVCIPVKYLSKKDFVVMYGGGMRNNKQSRYPKDALLRIMER